MLFSRHVEKILKTFTFPDNARKGPSFVCCQLNDFFAQFTVFEEHCRVCVWQVLPDFLLCEMERSGVLRRKQACLGLHEGKLWLLSEVTKR